jgi:hypothetical protein
MHRHKYRKYNVRILGHRFKLWKCGLGCNNIRPRDLAKYLRFTNQALRRQREAQHDRN